MSHAPFLFRQSNRRLSEPTLSASICRKAAELDPASLVRIERQRELLEPFAHVVPEPPGVSLAPAYERAVQLVYSRIKEIDGDRYELLDPAAVALEGKARRLNYMIA